MAVTKDNPCPKGKFHDFAKSGIRYENGKYLRKCYNCKEEQTTLHSKNLKNK